MRSVVGPGPAMADPSPSLRHFPPGRSISVNRCFKVMQVVLIMNAGIATHWRLIIIFVVLSALLLYSLRAASSILPSFANL